jgi:O-Antigen ligase
MEGAVATTVAAPAATGAIVERLAITALMLLPGALIVFTGFNAGGYFPATPAILAIVLSQILLVRIVQARHPFEGLTLSTLVALVALAAYALMTLLSTLWSHASGRALIEFDRAWMYLLVLLLLGSVRPSTQNLRWLVRGLLLGASVVCLAGLISRVLPNVWPTAPDVSNQRLSYPVTYWNTLGLLAALGIVLALHLACTLSERRPVRVLAAAMLPLLAATLFFTFSRGAIAAGAIGLVVYVCCARPRGLLSGVLATVPPTVALIVVAYHANLLDTVDPTTPAAVIEGHHVALVAGLCAAACAGLRLAFTLVLDPRLLRRSLVPSRVSSRTRRAAFAGVLCLAVAVALALGASHAVASDWNRFIAGAPTRGGHDLRQRLTDPSNDGRTDLWRVALNGVAASPLHGYGAGMYQTLWDRNRPHFVYTINAHSLYLQAMAELGLPGLALLAILVVAVLGGLIVRVRTRGPRRSLYGVLLACAVVWAVRAGVDWDWEMPVVTLGFFAAAGLALSPRERSSGLALSSRERSAGPALSPRKWSSGRDRPSGRGWTPGGRSRAALGLLCIAAVVLPVLVVGSQNRLGEAENALYASTPDCTTASTAALASIGWLDVRPEPFEIVGFCDLRDSRPREAVAEMRQAVRLDPGSWETYYALSIAQAAAGVDPMGAARRALRMDPLEPLTRQAVKEFQQGAGPRGWVSRARAVRAAALASNDLSIVPSTT